MPNSGDLDQTRRAKSLCGVSGDLDRHDPVLAPVHDEDRDANGRQHLANVDLLVHPVQRLEHPWARPVPQQIDVGLDLGFALHAEPLHELAGFLAIRIDAQRLLELVLVGLCTSPPREVRRPQRPRRAASDRERRNAVRIRRGEENAHRCPFGEPEEGRTLRAGRIHHGTNVVHARLEARRAADRIGHPGAPLVEADQPRERPEIVQELGEARQLPLQLHVRDEARYEDEVHRPFARDLVGDVHVAAQRVLRLSFHRYGWQIVRSRGTWSEQGGATEPRKTTRQTLLRFRRMKSPLPA